MTVVHHAHVRAVKIKRWLRRWLRAFWTGLVPSLSDPGQINTLLLGAFGAWLWLTQVAHGGLSELANSVIGLLGALLASAFAFLLLLVSNLVAAGFKVRADHVHLGTWFGPRFVYHEPILLLTKIVTSEDDDKPQAFKVLDAEEGSLAEIKVTIDRTDERAKAQIGWPRNPLLMQWDNIRRDTQTKLRLPSDRRLTLTTNVAPEATPTTIRVHVASFELGPNSLRQEYSGIHPKPKSSS